MPTYRGIKTSFVHIPKTAGSGIANRLWTANQAFDETPLEIDKHESILSIQGYLDKQSFGTYFKFAIVRNPYDKLVSWYHYYRDFWGNGKSENPPCNPEHIAEFLKWDFDEYVANIKRYHKWDCHTEIACPHHMIAEQYKYIIGHGNLVLIDDLGRVEFLEEDWKRISERIGLEYNPLDRTNTSDHKPWPNYYKNETTARRVLGLYKKDFEYFDYDEVIKYI